MRKITREISTAFLDGKILYKDNTSTDNGEIRLFGNLIAYWNTDSSVVITLAGHNTKTTRERLNGLLELMQSDRRIGSYKGEPRLKMKKFDWLPDAELIDPYEEITIEYGFFNPSNYARIVGE